MTPETSAADQDPAPNKTDAPVPKPAPPVGEMAVEFTPRAAQGAELDGARQADSEKIKQSEGRASSDPANRARDFAKNTDPIPGFSAPASKQYAALVSRYILDLDRFSRFKAKAASVEQVSKQHVTEAGDFLSSSRVPSKKVRYCETAGGILLGLGVSELITLVQAKTLSAHLFIVTAALIAVGGVMIGVFLGRE
jgi:hypothetical protein